MAAQKSRFYVDSKRSAQLQALALRSILSTGGTLKGSRKMPIPLWIDLHAKGAPFICFTERQRRSATEHLDLNKTSRERQNSKICNCIIHPPPSISTFPAMDRNSDLIPPIGKWLQQTASSLRERASRGLATAACYNQSIVPPFASKRSDKDGGQHTGKKRGGSRRHDIWN